jgi:hypothetical protein
VYVSVCVFLFARRESAEDVVVRKTPFLSRFSLDLKKRHQFTKTGSGQTHHIYGNVGEEIFLKSGVFCVRRRCCPRSCCCAPSTTRTTLRAVPQQQQQQRKLSARGPHRARLRRRRRRQRKLSGRVAAALLASPAGVTTAALGAISGEKQTNASLCVLTFT